MEGTSRELIGALDGVVENYSDDPGRELRLYDESDAAHGVLEANGWAKNAVWFRTLQVVAWHGSAAVVGMTPDSGVQLRVFLNTLQLRDVQTDVGESTIVSGAHHHVTVSMRHTHDGDWLRATLSGRGEGILATRTRITPYLNPDRKQGLLAKFWMTSAEILKVAHDDALTDDDIVLAKFRRADGQRDVVLQGRNATHSSLNQHMNTSQLIQLEWISKTLGEKVRLNGEEGTVSCRGITNEDLLRDYAWNYVFPKIYEVRGSQDPISKPF